MSLDRPCKNVLPLVYQPHSFVERALEAYGYKRERDAYRLESIGILIATGSYGGLLPEHYAQLGAKRHPLAKLPKSPVYNNIAAITEVSRPMTKRIELFLDILDELLRERRSAGTLGAFAWRAIAWRR